MNATLNSLKKSPVLIILGFISILILIYFSPVEKLFRESISSDFQIKSSAKILKNILVTALSFCAIKKFKVFKLSGLDYNFKWKYKYLIVIAAYIVIIGGMQLLNYDFSELLFSDVLLLFLSMLSVGFAEEFFFRGLLTSFIIKNNLHKQNGILKSIIISSVIFGSMHLLNFRIVNWPKEVSQVLYAFFLGIFFSAVLYRTNRLLPLVIMHGSIDFVFGLNTLFKKSVEVQELDLTSSISSAITTALLILPVFIIGLSIIKKIKRENIKEKVTLVSDRQDQIQTVI